MRRILSIISFCFCIVSTNAQSVASLYTKYVEAVEIGDMETAFSLMKECSDKTYHCPFASTALAILYELGYGSSNTYSNPTIEYLYCQDFEYLVSRASGSNNTLANISNALGITIDSNQLNEELQQSLLNYEKYMKFDEVGTSVLKAFSFRKSAINEMEGYEEYKADGDIEGMLVCAQSAEEDCLAADSLASDSYSQYLLGKIYYEGLLGFKDKETGLGLIKESANDDCISALVYLAKIDIKDGKTDDAKEKLERALNEEVRQHQPLLKETCYSLISPNFDHYDTRKSYEEAKNLIRQMK